MSIVFHPTLVYVLSHQVIEISESIKQCQFQLNSIINILIKEVIDLFFNE